MFSLANSSFRSKILLYAACTSGSALLLACAGVVVIEWHDGQEMLPRTVSSQGDVIAANVTAAVTFDDRKAAEEILSGLSADLNIVAAEVKRNDGEVFAEYIREGKVHPHHPHPKTSTHHFYEGDLTVARPIILDGETIGSVHIHYDTREFYSRLRREVGIIVVLMFGALGVAFLFSSRFQRILTAPVGVLVRTARAISDNKDYSLRATKHSNDELGALADAFNEMLAKIQRRDSALQEAHNNLELRVDERTAELAETNRDLAQLNDQLSSTARELKGLMKQVADEEVFTARFSNQSLTPCWELEECDNEACPAYRLMENLRCWEITGTLCKGGIQGTVSQKLADCRECRVYQSTRVDSISDLGETFNDMIAILEDRQEKLTEALHAAEAANQVKSEFLANMSHEIRTPMTAILGFTDVLLEHGDLDEAPPERIEAAQTIKRNREYLINIINDILDLSKIEAGKMTVEKIECSPCQIVAETASLMRVRADAKGLPFNIEYVGAIPETIHTDPIRLRQVLINLLGNAIKFTEVGGVRLIVRFVEDTNGKQRS